MNAELIKVYDKLVPADQLIIDSMILVLAKKDKEIMDTTAEVVRFLDRQKNKNEVKE